MTYKIDKLGESIKRTRLEQKRTLQSIAEECGFSKSLLSKIENGKVSPPMTTLSKIAQALRIKMSTLLEQDDLTEAVFTSADDLAKGAIKTTIGYSMLPFATDFKNKKMQPFIFIAEKGKVNMKESSHEGQELVYILEGSMEFKVGNTVYTLNEGDSLYFEAVLKHKINPTSDKLKYIDVFVE
jgi:transcriptional regulator with XRE-family HTH domain